MGKHHPVRRGLATRVRQNRDCTIATGIVIASFVIPLALVKPHHEHIFGNPAAARTPPAALADPTPELLYPVQRVVPLRLLALPEFKPTLEHHFQMPTLRESVRPAIHQSSRSEHINAGEGKHRADSTPEHSDSGHESSHEDKAPDFQAHGSDHGSHDGGHGSEHGSSEHHSDGGHSDHGSDHEGHGSNHEGSHESHDGGHSGGHGGHGGGHGGGRH